MLTTRPRRASPLAKHVLQNCTCCRRSKFKGSAQQAQRLFCAVDVFQRSTMYMSHLQRGARTRPELQLEGRVRSLSLQESKLLSRASGCHCHLHGGSPHLRMTNMASSTMASSQMRVSTLTGRLRADWRSREGTCETWMDSRLLSECCPCKLHMWLSKQAVSRHPAASRGRLLPDWLVQCVKPTLQQRIEQANPAASGPRKGAGGLHAPLGRAGRPPRCRSRCTCGCPSQSSSAGCCLRGMRGGVAARAQSWRVIQVSGGSCSICVNAPPRWRVQPHACRHSPQYTKLRYLIHPIHTGTSRT